MINNYVHHADIGVSLYSPCYVAFNVLRFNKIALKDGITSLNTAFSNEGAFIHIPKNKFVEKHKRNDQLVELKCMLRNVCWYLIIFYSLVQNYGRVGRYILKMEIVGVVTL